MYLNAFGLAESFKLFTSVLDLGNHYGDIPFGSIVVVVVDTIIVGVVVGTDVGLVVVKQSVMPLGESPSWKLACL